MEIQVKTSSRPIVAITCDMVTFLRYTIPCFCLISSISSSSARIYRSYSNGEIPMVSFVAFVCFAAFLLYYCSELNQRMPPWEKSPKKHKIQIGIWLLMNALMVGCCFKFSRLTRSPASFSFLWAVTSGNLLVLQFYSFWGDYNLRNRSATNSRAEKTRVMETGESTPVYESV